MRVVSLCPSLTELVFDLGRGADLVAVTDYCVHPAAGVVGIEKVGGTKSPRIDRVIALEPDLVLLNEEENCAADAEALVAAGIACHTSLPKTIAETADMVRSIGRAIDRNHEAETIAAAIAARREAAARSARERSARTFAYLIWRRPWMTVSGDTYPHDLLAAAGGVNVFASHADRYPTISLAVLGAAQPAAVLLGSEPFPFSDRHAEELAAALDWPTERFRLVDGELLSWHGSRTPAGIDYAVELFDELARQPAAG